MLKKWEDLPIFMQNIYVKPYWEELWKKRRQLVLKRIFDLLMAFLLLIILLLPMLIIAVVIKLEDGGPIFYRQERVTRYGLHFRIHKFRTMVVNADKIGTAVTVGKDPRITKIGHKLRKYRLDELPQLIDIIENRMSFVGTRPEAVKYVEQYLPEYYATFLLPAGITSETSIMFKDEDRMLAEAEDAEKAYLEDVLPKKMELNLASIKNFNIATDVLTMIKTVLAVLKH